MAKKEIIQPDRNMLPDNFKPTDEQSAIGDVVASGDKNVLVSALAGTGKTTTGVFIMDKIPSDKSVTAVAFSNTNVDTFKQRFKKGIFCTTTHSLGLAALREGLSMRYMDLEQHKYLKIIEKETDDEQLKYEVDDLVHFSRVYLCPISDDAKYAEIVNRFGLNPTKEARSIAEKAIAVGNEMAIRKGVIDFDDMLYLPHELDYYPKQADVLFADECQDFSPAQLSLLRKAVKSDGQSIYVGDTNQSIFAFTGATQDSIQKIIDATNATILPLRKTFRCAKSHVDMINQLYPHIELVYDDGNDEGVITNIPEFQLAELVQPGDWVLCRTTAPLISAAFDAIRLGKKAKVLGKEIGANICKPLMKMKKNPNFRFSSLYKWIDVEYESEYKRLVSQKRGKIAFANLSDRFECLRVCADLFYDKCYSVDEFINRIKDLFSDDKSDVTYSVVHRAKGREAHRVFIIKYNKMPMRWENQQDWELQQEKNIHYVALSRSKHALYLSSEATA